MNEWNVEKKLVEYINESGIWEFFFNGFDFQEDFVEIIRAINVCMQPVEVVWYGGWDEAHGSLVKEGICVEMECNMAGNQWTYKNDGTEQELEKVRSWARLVWDKLMEQPIQ